MKKILRLMWMAQKPGGYSLIWVIRVDRVIGVPLDRVWFFGLADVNRVYNLTCLCPKQF